MNSSRSQKFGFYSARNEYSRKIREPTREMSKKPNVSQDLGRVGKQDVFREFFSLI
jgi:hypothetical protein